MLLVSAPNLAHHDQRISINRLAILNLDIVELVVSSWVLVHAVNVIVQLHFGIRYHITQTTLSQSLAGTVYIQGGPVELILFHIALRFEKISLTGPPCSYIANNMILARASCRKKREEGSERAGNLKFHILSPIFSPQGMEKINSYVKKKYAQLSNKQLCKLWDFQLQQKCLYHIFFNLLPYDFSVAGGSRLFQVGPCYMRRGRLSQNLVEPNPN